MRLRPARPDDAAAMAALLAPLVAEGRSAAIENEVDEGRAAALLAGLGPRDFVNLVEERGVLLGWQLVEAAPGLPEAVADIATFVAAPRRGVGRALIAAALVEAPRRGWRALSATIRADNAPGRAFYAAMGFRPFAIARAIPLKSGRKLDRWTLRRPLGAARRAFAAEGEPVARTG